MKPGVYTLRFALQPQNGNHLGVSSNREFLLVCPSALDTTPDPLGYKGTVDLAKQTSSAIASVGAEPGSSSRNCRAALTSQQRPRPLGPRVLGCRRPRPVRRPAPSRSVSSSRARSRTDSRGADGDHRSRRCRPGGKADWRRRRAGAGVARCRRRPGLQSITPRPMRPPPPSPRSAGARSSCRRDLAGSSRLRVRVIDAAASSARTAGRAREHGVGLREVETAR